MFRNPGPGEHALVADVAAEPVAEVAPEVDLPLGPRPEVGVPPFGGDRVVARAVPVEHRLARARSRRRSPPMFPARLGLGDGPGWITASSAAGSESIPKAVASRSLSSLTRGTPMPSASAFSSRSPGQVRQLATAR